MKTHFHMKGHAPRLALKKRYMYKTTRKWPFVLYLQHGSREPSVRTCKRAFVAFLLHVQHSLKEVSLFHQDGLCIGTLTLYKLLVDYNRSRKKEQICKYSCTFYCFHDKETT